MAKLECRLHAPFDAVLDAIDTAILRGSVSASREDGSDFSAGGHRCAVRVYERYSVIGSNRVSLNVTLLEDGPGVLLSAITSGGSQAVFFKLNTFGEESFLDCVRDDAARGRSGRAAERHHVRRQSGCIFQAEHLWGRELSGLRARRGAAIRRQRLSPPASAGFHRPCPIRPPW